MFLHSTFGTQAAMNSNVLNLVKGGLDLHLVQLGALVANADP